LSKLDQGQYAAIILAVAGLERLGLADRIRSRISVEDSLPAAGQGALGIEILQKRSDLLELLTPLSCHETTACALAERAVSRALGGSCQVPLAAFAQVNLQTLTVRALVAQPDGRMIYRAQASGLIPDANKIGQTVADDLLSQGAGRILSELSHDA
jgi:hydroxymethylbilane synthase